MISTSPEVQEEKLILASSIKGGKNKLHGKEKKGDLLPALLFLSPTLIIFTTFILFPVFFSFYLSFHEWNMFSGETTFIGIDNYVRMFNNEEFWEVFKNTAIYTFGTIPLNMCFKD